MPMSYWYDESHFIPPPLSPQLSQLQLIFLLIQCWHTVVALQQNPAPSPSYLPCPFLALPPPWCAKGPPPAPLAAHSPWRFLAPSVSPSGFTSCSLPPSPHLIPASPRSPPPSHLPPLLALVLLAALSPLKFFLTTCHPVPHPVP